MSHHRERSGTSAEQPLVPDRFGQRRRGLRTAARVRQPTGTLFWSDDVSLRDDSRFDLSRLRGHKQITDLYCAALVARQGGKLATFDTAIPGDAQIGGTDDLVEVIPLA